MVKRICILLVCCVVGVNGCGKADSDSVTDSNDIKEAVAGNSNFAFDLYGKLKNNNPNGNLFFSPYSISTALAMTYAGARGETEKQMAAALHFTLPGPRLYPAFGVLQKQLVQDDKSRGYQLLLANALWGQKGEPFLKEFLDLNQNYYGAGLALLDFVSETENSRQIINSWVEEETKEKIKDLIPPGGVDKLTALVLTNAIYFKGKWKTEFEKKDTKLADFTVTAKDKVQVAMMHIKADFRYGGNANMKIIELPYKGNKLSMVVLLPREIEGIKEVENTLTTESLNTLLSNMYQNPKIYQRKVDLYLPKFKITWGTVSLKKALIELGMRDAFGNADFSGINGRGGIWISDVFHKAFVEVNEEGTEAAAGTGVVIKRGSSLEFRVNHPFIFIIRDNQTGSILFMGRVMNPAE